MKTKVLLAALAFILSISLIARAAPYDPALVPASAQWVIHFDLDGIKNLDVVKELEKIELKTIGEKGAMKRIRFLLSSEGLGDVHSVLLYGSQFSGDRAVLMIAADFKAPMDRFEKDFKHGAHEVLSRKSENEKAYGCFHKPNLLVLAHDKDDMAGALDALDGKTPRLQNDSMLAAPAMKNAVFHSAAARIPRIIQKEPWGSIIDKMSDASLTIAVAKNEIQALVILTASSDEVASSVVIILKGIQATMSFRNPQLDNPIASIAWSLFSTAQIDSIRNRVKIEAKTAMPPVRSLIGVIASLPASRPTN